MRRNLAIILAGGSGLRMGNKIAKQYLILRGKPILQYSLHTFISHPQIHEIMVVARAEDLQETKKIIDRSASNREIKVLPGGRCRQESARIGVMAAGQNIEKVLIHDAVRPFVSAERISELIKRLDIHPAIGLAIPVVNTVVQVDEKKQLQKVPDRAGLRLIQTPQAFRRDIIQKAHQLALQQGITKATDDCSLVFIAKLAPVHILEGHQFNIKITYPHDMVVAEDILTKLHKGIVG